MHKLSLTSGIGRKIHCFESAMSPYLADPVPQAVRPRGEREGCDSMPLQSDTTLRRLKRNFPKIHPGPDHPESAGKPGIESDDPDCSRALPANRSVLAVCICSKKQEGVQVEQVAKQIYRFKGRIGRERKMGALYKRIIQGTPSEVAVRQSKYSVVF